MISCFVHSYLRVLKHVNISRTEYYLRGCVLTTLEKDVGCSMDDVERVMKREEVRQGLLDSISLDYCGKFFLSIEWFMCTIIDNEKYWGLFSDCLYMNMQVYEYATSLK